MGDYDGYTDWPAHVARQSVVSGDEWTTRIGSALGVPTPPSSLTPRTVTSSQLTCEGVDLTTTELAYDVGFGPELHAYLLHPTGTDPRELPGVLALHSHAGLKSVGAARMVQLPGAPGAVVAGYRNEYSSGLPFATRLAARGVTVLAPDAFSWGSRRFDLGAEGAEYDELARSHEHMVAKLAGVLGTSYAGMIAHDDLASLSVLRDLCNGHIGVCGFSGGGGRSINLSTLASVNKVAVIGMMATFDSLIPDYLMHSWLLHTPGLALTVDLPEMAAGRLDHDLLVVYCLRDHLFPESGMRAADAWLADRFTGSGHSYESVFVETDHEFGREIQNAVADFLTR